MKCRIAALTLAALMIPAIAMADDTAITYSGGKFSPDTVTIPAGQKVKLVISNNDAAPMEFESHDLKREKVIPAHSQATVSVGPLKPGSYPFVNEFHEDTAKGTLVVQ